MSTIVDGTTGVSLVQDGVVVQADLAANVVGNGPAFRSYMSAAQTFATTADTKVNFDTSDFDTSSSFSSGSYTPPVAGYYQVNARLMARTAAAAGVTLSLYLRKDTNTVRSASVAVPGTAFDVELSVSGLVYMNGANYFEVWAGSTSASTTTLNPSGAVYATEFSAALVRKA
jgi:hypothetical protein